MNSIKMSCALACVIFILSLSVVARGEASPEEVLNQTPQSSTQTPESNGNGNAITILKLIYGFYTAAQATAIVPPGATGDLISVCDQGDFAVSGQTVVFADNFELIYSVLITDVANKVEQWALQGINKGSTDANIRLSATCADRLPLHR